MLGSSLITISFSNVFSQTNLNQGLRKEFPKLISIILTPSNSSQNFKLFSLNDNQFREYHDLQTWKGKPSL